MEIKLGRKVFFRLEMPYLRRNSNDVKLKVKRRTSYTLKEFKNIFQSRDMFTVNSYLFGLGLDKETFKKLVKGGVC